MDSATGLILRTRPLTETSLIVQWLTAEFGRLDTVAKGARRPKSPFGGKLDLFYLAEFSFARSPRSDLHTLREVCLLDPHLALRRDLACLQQAAYAARLIEQTTETQTPLPGIFALLRDLLALLPNRPAQPRTVFAFELKLLAELGLQPDLSRTELGAGTQALVRALQQGSWEEIATLRPSAAEVTELQQFLHGFLIFHLGRLAPGRAAALAR